MRFNVGWVVGLFLLVAGASILAKEVFHVDIPVFRIGFAAVLIYAGVSILLGVGGYRPPGVGQDMVVFSNAALVPDGEGKMNVIMGRGDLEVGPTLLGKALELNVVFGDAVLKLDPDVPARVVSTTAFGSTTLPDTSSTGFGDRTWTSPSWKAGAPAVDIRTNVVFGALRVQRADESPITASLAH